MEDVSSTCRPEMALSMQLGINVSYCSGAHGTSVTLLALPADWYVQMPFSDCQLSRFSCGRGCSGHGFSPTWSVQGVSSGGTCSSYGTGVDGVPVQLLLPKGGLCAATASGQRRWRAWERIFT